MQRVEQTKNKKEVLSTMRPKIQHKTIPAAQVVKEDGQVGNNSEQEMKLQSRKWREHKVETINSSGKKRLCPWLEQ